MVSGFKVEMSEVNLLLPCDSTVGSCDTNNNFNHPLKLAYGTYTFSFKCSFAKLAKNHLLMVHSSTPLLHKCFGSLTCRGKKKQTKQ
jgi:hypothetical protein